MHRYRNKKMYEQSNHSKSLQKQKLMASLRGSLARISNEINEIETTVNMLDQAVSGMPSGSDRHLIDACRQTAEELRKAMNGIQQSFDASGNLKTDQG